MSRIGDRGEMEAFVRSVERGGFSAAARDLKLTPSALSKMVTRLESVLGVRLLNRTTRKLTPTAEGALFLARCRRIVAEFEDAEREVGRSREKPRGKLLVHAGVGFATNRLVPAMPRFVARYPEVQVELIVEDRDLDVVTKRHRHLGASRAAAGPVAGRAQARRVRARRLRIARIPRASRRAAFTRRAGHPCLHDHLEPARALAVAVPDRVGPAGHRGHPAPQRHQRRLRSAVRPHGAGHRAHERLHRR